MYLQLLNFITAVTSPAENRIRKHVLTCYLYRPCKYYVDTLIETRWTCLSNLKLKCNVLILGESTAAAYLDHHQCATCTVKTTSPIH